MKKLFILFIFSFTTFVSVQAQKLPTVFCDVMPVEESYSQVVLLKKGNTGLIRCKSDGETYFTLFDKSRKVIKDGMVEFTSFKGRVIAAESVFEINNDVVAFLSYFNKKDRSWPTVKVIFDGTTGAIKKEEPVGKPVLAIEKDPNSEYYAILYNSADGKTQELVHYGPSHQEINKGVIPAPSVKPQWTENCMAMYVNAAEYIVLASYTSDSKKKGEKAAVSVSKLAKSSATVSTVLFPNTASLSYPVCRFLFDKTSSSLSMIVKTYGGYDKGKTYSYFIQPLNAAKMEFGKPLTITSEKASAYFNAKIQNGDNFNGLPQNGLVDPAGNYVILSENVNLMTSDPSLGYDSEMFYIGVTSMTKEGKENFGWVATYRHMVKGDASSLTFFDNRKGKQPYPFRDIYNGTSIDMVAGKKYIYVFANSTQEEFKRAENDPTFPMLRLVFPLTGVFYKIDSKTGALTKGTLFDNAQANKDNADYGMFNRADYDSETGTYAVLVTDRIKGKKTYRVAWITLE